MLSGHRWRNQCVAVRLTFNVSGMPIKKKKGLECINIASPPSCDGNKKQKRICFPNKTNPLLRLSLRHNSRRETDYELFVA